MTILECGLFAFLFFFTLLVNYPVISFNMIYPEQHILYVANQSIHSVGQLLGVYLQPKMLNIFYIPFFRPSGHFLLYQIIVPFLGWHNTQGFIVINLFFLALAGLMMIKLYELLFPAYKTGGYIAFAIYLMHPALNLSRLMSMHFEFAYIFFVLLSLYFFVCFCQKNKMRFSFLMGALFFYFIAVTFKESAIMLGPVMVVYFSLQFNFKEKQNRQILALLMISTVTLGLYLTLQWPAFIHPLWSNVTFDKNFAAADELFRAALGLQHDIAAQKLLVSPDLIWRKVIFPKIFYGVMWFLLFILLVSFFKLKSHQDKKTLFFLGVSVLLFLILPVGWAIGLPWHLSLSLVFLSLMMGFGFESVFPYRIMGFVVALFIGLTTIVVNQVNIKNIIQNEGFALSLGRNAVFDPPALKNKINSESVIIIEDSVLHDGYYLGDNAYPTLIPGEYIFDDFQKQQETSFIQFQSVYDGSLFKWAYLMPTIKEEVYSFRVSEMERIPDEVIHRWLQHYDNIFCLGYNKDAHWYDHTAAFKENLLKEQGRRNLVAHSYNFLPAEALAGDKLYSKNLGFPDANTCEYTCDQDSDCHGFTYIHSEMNHHNVMQCQFYNRIISSSKRFCAACTGFIKNIS